jgi:hypothetical protein
MRRILLGLTCALGMLALGATSASASTLCTLDPTIRVGTPLHYSLNVSVLGTHVYASGTSHSTTFGGVIGI